MSTAIDATVAVVGGGPVGMVTALELHRRGVSVVVIEAESDEVRSEWRGSTLHPPTLEIFDELGVAGPILAAGVRLDRMVYRDLELDEQATFYYDLITEHTQYPFRMQYEQYKVLRHLKDALADRGISVLYQHRLESFAQDERAVSLVLTGPNGERSLRANWLVGADGAHSVIRKGLKIAFPGFTYPTQSLVVATPFPFEDHISDLPPVSYWSGPRGRVSVIRTPDIWRVAISTSLGIDDEYDYSPGNPHPSFIDGMTLLLGGKVDPAAIDLHQHQFYRSHQRVAEQFRVGRVVLAGDAAHLSSTTGGMGLNSGVHDAYQLAKAFSADDVDVSLSEYARGRKLVAENLVQPMTTLNRAGTDMLDRQHRLTRLHDLQSQAADPESARRHLFQSAMLGAAGLAPASN